MPVRLSACDDGLIDIGIRTGPISFWLIAYLLTHPEAFEAVQKEVDQLWERKPNWWMLQQGSDFNTNLQPATASPISASTGPSPVQDSITQHLDNAVVLTSVVQETFRLTAHSFSLRVATSDGHLQVAEPPKLSLSSSGGAELGKGLHRIPVKAGDTIFIFPTHHRNSSIFPKPNDFVFDRFVPTAEGKLRSFNLPDGKSLQPVRV
jgi:cytochrome P450